MKKLLLSLLLLTALALSLPAAEFEVLEEKNPVFYTYLDLSMGYGFTDYWKSDSSNTMAHAISYGLKTGFTYLDYSRPVNYGLAIRNDILLDYWGGHSSIDFMIGPALTFHIARMVDLQFSVGPSFTFLGRADGKKTATSIAPAADLSFEFYGSMEKDLVSFKTGLLLTGQLGVSTRLYGFTLSPYVALSVHDGGFLLLLPLFWYLYD